jgi:hypothetical protein
MGEQWATGDGEEILRGEAGGHTSMIAVEEADNPRQLSD